MNVDEIYDKVGKEINVPKNEVEKIYKAYWKAIREHITSLPLKEDLTDEQFNNLQPNVNIPSIGKLYVTLDRYRSMKNTWNRYQQLKNRNNDTHKKD